MSCSLCSLHTIFTNEWQRESKLMDEGYLCPDTEDFFKHFPSDLAQGLHSFEAGKLPINSLENKILKFACNVELQKFYIAKVGKIKTHVC